MKTHHIIVAILAFLSCTQTLQSQSTLTVSDGKSYVQCAPFKASYANYAIKGEYVVKYDQLQLMKGKTITSIKVYPIYDNTEDCPYFGPFKVFMKEVDSQAPYTGTNSQFLGMDGATVVYEGTVVAANKVIEVKLDEYYTYGGRNLLIGFYKEEPGGYAMYNPFYSRGYGISNYTSCGGEDRYNFDNITTGTGDSYTPKTTFTYDDDPPFIIDQEKGLKANINIADKPHVIIRYQPHDPWNTIAMPFNLTAEDMNAIFGNEWKAYELTGYENGNMTFTLTTTILAGHPYVVYAPTPPSPSDITKLNVSFTEPTPVTFTDNGKTLTFMASYSVMNAGSMVGLYGIMPGDGHIMKGGEGARQKAFRGYFEISDNTSANLTATFLDTDGNTTDIKDIKQFDDLQSDNWYDLSGRKINRQTVNRQKGVVIHNGKKVAGYTGNTDR